MSTNKKERNTQIPVEAIEGPAGENEKCVIVFFETGILEKDNKHHTTEVGAHDKREIAPNSMDLTEGMIIKAENNELQKGEDEPTI